MKDQAKWLALFAMIGHLLSGVLFYLATTTRLEPHLVFSLQLSPLNVTTDGVVDQEVGTIAFSSINQSIVIENLPKGILRLQIVLSGGFIVEPTDDDQAPLLLEISEASIPVHVDHLITTLEHTWVHLTEAEIRLRLVNFVKIEAMMYGVYIQDLRIYQQKQ